MNKRKIFLNLLIILLVSGIIIAVMLTDESSDDAINILKNTNYLYILAAFSCMIVFWILGSLNIRVIKRGMIGGQKDPGGNMLALLTHDFISAVTPFASGGQPVVVYVLAKKGLDAGAATSVAAIRTFIYQIVEFSLVLIGFFTLRSYLLKRVPHFLSLFIPALAISTTLITLIFVFLSEKKLANKLVNIAMKLLKRFFPKKYDAWEKKVYESLNSFKEALSIFGRHPRYWFYALSLQAMELILTYLVPVFMLRAIEGVYTDVFALIVSTSICTMISSYVPTPGTTGGAEGLAILLIAPFFVSSPALPVILIWRLITYYSKIVIGGVAFTYAIKGEGKKGRKVRAKDFVQ